MRSMAEQLFAKRIIGGGGLIPLEPLSENTYLYVFITHFLSRPSQNPGILRKLYLDFKLSSQQIKELTNHSWEKPSIIAALRKFNIKRNRLPSRIKFGEKLVRGQKVLHLGEQKIIKEILELRASKMSLRAIANYLNEKNIPSKLGQKWNKTTIGEIIKRHQKGES